MYDKYWYEEMLHQDWKLSHGMSAVDYGGPSLEAIALHDMEDEADRLDDEGWDWLEEE